MSEADKVGNVIQGHFGAPHNVEVSAAETVDDTEVLLAAADYDVHHIERNGVRETIIGFQGLRRYCEREQVAHNYPASLLNKLAWLGLRVVHSPEHHLHATGVFYEESLQDGVTPLNVRLEVSIERLAENVDPLFHELQYTTANDAVRLGLLAKSLAHDFATPPTA